MYVFMFHLFVSYVILLILEGSWEHAAVSTFHDGHNQLGLNLLSYAMEMQKSAKKHGDLLVIVDRLFVASDLMLATVNSIENMVEAATQVGYHTGEMAFSGQRYAEGYAPLSTPFVHLLKNTGLCLMRLESLLVVAVTFQDKMHELVWSKDPAAVAFQVLRSVIMSLLTSLLFIICCGYRLRLFVYRVALFFLYDIYLETVAV